jgi:hypothetical protein
LNETEDWINFHTYAASKCSDKLNAAFAEMKNRHLPNVMYEAITMFQGLHECRAAMIDGGGRGGIWRLAYNVKDIDGTSGKLGKPDLNNMATEFRTYTMVGHAIGEFGTGQAVGSYQKSMEVFSGLVQKWNNQSFKSNLSVVVQAFAEIIRAFYKRPEYTRAHYLWEVSEGKPVRNLDAPEKYSALQRLTLDYYFRELLQLAKDKQEDLYSVLLEAAKDKLTAVQHVQKRVESLQSTHKKYWDYLVPGRKPGVHRDTDDQMTVFILDLWEKLSNLHKLFVDSNGKFNVSI